MSRIRGRLLACLTAGVLASAFAETSVFPAAPTATDILAHFYGQDLFITPGKGFRTVQIGAPFQNAVQAWGPPQRVEVHPLFGLSRRAIWPIGIHGKVILSGSSRIQEIEISGDAALPLQTVEGARLGMPAYQLATIYGPAASSSESQISYPARGIAFALGNGLVTAMKVFAPQGK